MKGVLRVGCGTLIALVVAAGACLPHAQAAPDRSRRVPDVVGFTPRNARDALRGAGFGVRVIEVAGPTVGEVAAQDPAAGKRLSAGATVTLRVGVPARTKTRMPNVVGLPVEDALTSLARSYDVHVRRKGVADRRQAGQVLSSTPAANAELPFRGSVTLVIGQAAPVAAPPAEVAQPAASSATGIGPAPQVGQAPPVEAGPATDDAGLPPLRLGPGTSVSMPDVEGKSERQALVALAQVGIRPEIIRADDPSAPAGTVLQQTPPPGTAVKSGGDAWLMVTGGGIRVDAPLPEQTPPPANPMPAPTTSGFPPADTTPTARQPGATPQPGTAPPAATAQAPSGTQVVPQLVGQTYSTATRASVAAGLAPHPWFVQREGVPAWQVIAQKDAVGARLNKGDVLHFRVALPAQRTGTVAMPYLYGLTKEQATNVMRGLGLGLTARLIEAHGLITLQKPVAGSPLPWGATVSVVVGKAHSSAQVTRTAEIPLLAPAAPAAPTTPPAASSPRRKKNVGDRVKDFFDDRADDIRDIFK